MKAYIIKLSNTNDIVSVILENYSVAIIEAEKQCEENNYDFVIMETWGSNKLETVQRVTKNQDPKTYVAIVQGNNGESYDDYDYDIENVYAGGDYHEAVQIATACTELSCGYEVNGRTIEEWRSGRKISQEEV